MVIGILLFSGCEYSCPDGTVVSSSSLCAEVTKVDIIEIERLPVFSMRGNIWLYPRGLVKYNITTQGEIEGKRIGCLSYVDGNKRGNVPETGTTAHEGHNEEEWPLEVGSHTFKICCSFDGTIEEVCDGSEYFVEDDWDR